MDTPAIAAYYREHDPLKRKAYLEESIQAGEEPEANAIRREIWEVRYSKKAEKGAGSRADGYMGLWMAMEFNKDASKKLFGAGAARKEIMKHLKALKFKEFQEKSPLHHELLYRECCQMVKMYMELCESDRSYNTTLCGIMSISNDKAKAKLQQDILTTAILFPPSVKLEEELGIVMKAAREMYEVHFPGEGGLPEA